MEYHVGWTYPLDPFNLIDPEDVLLRQEFYDVLATPTFRMDGLWMGDHSTLAWRYDQHKGWPSPATLSIRGTWDPSSRELTLQVTAVTDTEPPPGLVRLYVALTESEIYYPINGVDWHDHQLFDMLPDGAGTVVDLAGAPPQTASVLLSAVLPDPEGPFNFDPDHCRVIAWLQLDAPDTPDDHLALQCAGVGVTELGAVAAGELPIAEPRLLAAHPNPFNPHTVIPVTMPAAGRARLSVHGVDGRLLRVFQSGLLGEGRHEFTWDGTDEAGHTLPSGLYLLRLVSGGVSSSEKLVLLR